MTSPAALREKAALCRRAAAKRTNGGRLEDKLLLAVAEELERQAESLEAERRGP